jgi:hypothetical protein
VKGVESAIQIGPPTGFAGVGTAKLRRDSQGSLPKIASHAYLDEKATEL